MAGEPLDFYERFQFRVEIDGITTAGFTTCSELSMEVGKIELREGGRPHSHKKPGHVSFTDVTLERGATDDSGFRDWMKQVVKFSTGRGEVGEDYKRELDIVQINRDGSERARYTLNKAWPVKYSAGEWDGNSEESLVESVTITYDNFTRTL